MTSEICIVCWIPTIVSVGIFGLILFITSKIIERRINKNDNKI